MFLSKHPLVLSLLLMTVASPLVSAGKTFENQGELRTMVVKWCDETFSEGDYTTYGPIEDWDVSKVYTMDNLFYDIDCSPKIGGWDVSRVYKFNDMFKNNRVFNSDISGWDVSNGQEFDSMFESADSFNQDISGWDVSRGESFEYMFREATSFNQDITGWDVSNANTFEDIFFGASSFNQPLLYCAWVKTNPTFAGGQFNPCDGTKSCGWNTPNCPLYLGCSNSPLKFAVETVGGSFLPYSCKFAKKNSDNLNCSGNVTATHCPKVCDACDQYECSDAEGMFFYGSSGRRKSLRCSKLRKMPVGKRIRKCRKDNVKLTCRETCRLCEDYDYDYDYDYDF